MDPHLENLDKTVPADALIQIIQHTIITSAKKIMYLVCLGWLTCLFGCLFVYLFVCVLPDNLKTNDWIFTKFTGCVHDEVEKD